MGFHDSIELRHIHKTYASNHIHACDDISLTIRAGERHIIVGENGAGKSTVMKILSGDIPPDSGGILLDGRPAAFSHPEAALDAGIGMIHQVLHFFPELTVRDHLILGMKQAKPFSRIRKADVDEHIRQIGEHYGIPCDPDEQVERLDAASRQLTALMTLISRDVDIFILDEPPAEILEAAGRLHEEGKTIIVITHNIEDALSFGDTVSVLRAGTHQGTFPTSSMTRERLAAMIMGDHDSRLLLDDGTRREHHSRKIDWEKAAPVIALDQVSGGRQGTRDFVEDISLTVSPGETLAVVGIRDNGLRALEAIVSGHASDTFRQTGGTVRLLGREPGTPGEPVGYIPSDRLSKGGAVAMSVTENLMIGWRREASLFVHPRIPIYSPKKLKRISRSVIKAFSIKGKAGDSLLSLSGGNIQKLITARALYHQPKVLICADISWGLDIQTRESLFDSIEVLKQEGLAVLFFTSEVKTALDEADRIAVLQRGRLKGIIANTPGMTAREIGEMML